MMKIDVLTLFPEMLEIPLQHSLLGKAREKGKINITIHDIRKYCEDRHLTADDAPFGGGEGMVLKPDPIFEAVEAITSDSATVILLSPQGETFNQKLAEGLATLSHIIFICGHYEGVDERVRKHLVDREISLGDFVASGGEMPVLVIIDVISRLIPGVVGNEASIRNESFSDSIFDYPVYTRPRDFRGRKVPDVLLSGHHENIRIWRRKQALKNTVKKRPELLDNLKLNDEDQRLLNQIMSEQE